MGSHSLLHGTFLTQRLNPGFLHYRQILLSYEPPGKLLIRIPVIISLRAHCIPDRHLYLIPIRLHSEGYRFQPIFWGYIKTLTLTPETSRSRLILKCIYILLGFPGSSSGKDSTCNAGDPGLIPGSGRSTGEGIGYLLQYSWSLVAQMIKNLPAMWETWVQSLGSEDPLEESVATDSSILAWKIPWTGEHGGLQSMGSQRVGHDWAAKHSAAHTFCLERQNLEMKVKSFKDHFYFVLTNYLEIIILKRYL